MTKVSRKGFVDKNGDKVILKPIVPGTTAGNLAEFDTEGSIKDSGKKKSDFAPSITKEDTAADFEDSTVLGTMLNDGIFHVRYKPTTNNPANGYILLIRYYRAKPSAIAQTYKHYVEQTLIYNSGIKQRKRAFNDSEHTEPYAEWSSWENLIPETTSNITENATEAVTAGAVYTALGGKANAIHTHAGLLNEIVDATAIHFEVSNESFALVSDLTEYDDLFELYDGGIKAVPVYIGLYDGEQGSPHEDEWVNFLGFCVLKGYDEVYTKAEIYVGCYNITLTKNTSNNTVTLDVVDIASMLSTSSQS